MTRARGIAIAAVCLGAALGLTLAAPGDEVIQAPFVRAIPALDQQTATREITVTVTDVRLADRVQTAEWTGMTNGVWLVVDLEFTRRISRGGLSGVFRIGDIHYQLSERADLATLDNGASGQPDLPWAGSVLVELPLSALEDPAATHAVISFAGTSGPLGGGDLDGVLEYTIDLAALDHETSVTISEPSRVAPTGVAG
ncbi:MAG: hypothetical protein ACTHKX_10230 [Pseudolysinimonas sp.]